MKNITKVKAPKGFTFKIRKPYETVMVKLYDKLTDKEVGHVSLVKLKGKSYATHSWLHQDYHHKGLGTLMYARAIQWCHEHGFLARSSGHSSDMAKRVWNSKSIRQFYAIKKKDRADGYSTWYAYNKGK